MRMMALLVVVILVSCGPRQPEESRTAFDSPGTGSIEPETVPAGEPRLMPFRAMTSDVVVLQGDPDVPGEPFVIRIRELPGAIVPPHSHPVDEHITIVSGSWRFGFGDSFDPARLTELPAGSYGYAPKGSTMFAYAPEGAVVQIHGIGPFHIDWRHRAATLGEPGAERAFRYRRGDLVASPRGEGVIRRGYASGPVVQYEIEGRQGLFMAEERDLHQRKAPR